MDRTDESATDQTYDLDHMMHSIAELNRQEREHASQPPPNAFGRTQESEQIASTILNSVMMGLPHVPHVDAHSDFASLFEPAQVAETHDDEALITALAIKMFAKQTKP